MPKSTLLAHMPKISTPIRVGVVGLGRMGIIHALHVHELAQESGLCELVSVSSIDKNRVDFFQKLSGADVPSFDNIEEFCASGLCDVTLLATNTELHREHTLQLICNGHRVLLEKPLTGTLQGDRNFVKELEKANPEAVMLGFQRRFDAPLQYAKELISEGTIGRVFKVYSALEDSRPAPNGFQSPGLLADMAIHNVDEVLWLTGRIPESAVVLGSKIFSHRYTTCVEDFDDALMVLDFGAELMAHIEVSRNHVSGYRGETVIYGEKGRIQIGRFRQMPEEVLVEVYGAQDSLQSPRIRAFKMRQYGQGLPEFIDRFGDAYKQEVKTFLECCRDGEAFPVTHLDALRAQEVVTAAMGGAIGRDDMAPIEYLSVS
jgi:predicted dehydrogenase